MNDQGFDFSGHQPDFYLDSHRGIVEDPHHNWAADFHNSHYNMRPDFNTGFGAHHHRDPSFDFANHHHNVSFDFGHDHHRGAQTDHAHHHQFHHDQLGAGLSNWNHGLEVHFDHARNTMHGVDHQAFGDRLFDMHSGQTHRFEMHPMHVPHSSLGGVGTTSSELFDLFDTIDSGINLLGDAGTAVGTFLVAKELGKLPLAAIYGDATLGAAGATTLGGSVGVIGLSMAGVGGALVTGWKVGGLMDGLATMALGDSIGEVLYDAVYDE